MMYCTFAHNVCHYIFSYFVFMIKSKLNIFIIILFCNRKLELGKTPTLNLFHLHPIEYIHLHRFLSFQNFIILFCYYFSLFHLLLFQSLSLD